MPGDRRQYQLPQAGGGGADFSGPQPFNDSSLLGHAFIYLLQGSALLTIGNDLFITLKSIDYKVVGSRV